jgi:hypothetical protein
VAWVESTPPQIGQRNIEIASANEFSCANLWMTAAPQCGVPAAVVIFRGSGGYVGEEQSSGCKHCRQPYKGL